MSVDRLVCEIASSDFFASAGSVSMHVRADPGLHGDDAHRVRDDVVQFLRDAKSFVGDRALGFFVASALERDRALFELAGVEPAIADCRPEQVRGAEHGEVRHESGGVEVGCDKARDEERGRDPHRAERARSSRRVRAERVRTEQQGLRNDRGLVIEAGQEEDGDAREARAM